MLDTATSHIRQKNAKTASLSLAPYLNIVQCSVQAHLNLRKLQLRTTRGTFYHSQTRSSK